jgi:hypothetical protein
VRDLAASVNFSPPAPAYPEKVADVLARLGPIGVYSVAGTVDVDRTKPDPTTTYRLVVTTDAGAFSPSVVPNSPVIYPKGSFVVTNDSVESTDLTLSVYGGTITGGLRVKLAPRPTYAGDFTVHDVELADAKALWLKPGERQELQGKINGRVTLSGRVPAEGRPALEGLRAQGKLSVLNGYFYDAPVLRQVADWLRVDRGSIVGDAAVSFAIQDQVINLQRGVIAAPVLAAQAKGEIGLDGKLQLVVTAASPRQRSTPVGGNNEFVRGLIGAVNQGLANAGQWGLYEFHVTGTPDEPHLRVLTPAINQTIDSLVGNIRAAARENGKR